MYGFMRLVDRLTIISICSPKTDKKIHAYILIGKFAALIIKLDLATLYFWDFGVFPTKKLAWRY